MEKALFTTGNMGRNIERIRKIVGMKQETLADAIGISRQTLSKLEQSEFIEDEKLGRIAEALGVELEALKNFDEERTINFVQNNYDGSNKDANYLFGSNNNCSVSPFEKVMELVEENKKLYQQLIQSEREKVEMLQKILNEK